MIAEAILASIATALLALLEDANMALPSHYIGVVIAWAIVLATAIFQTT